MIANERQYRISKAQSAKFKQAIESFNVREATRQTGSKALAKAEFEALKSEYEILSEQIAQYEALKSGAVSVLKAQSLDELPGILIRARIARGLSQRQLADIIGIKEQQVQRYESEEYATASFRRLSEVAFALDLNIQEAADLRKKAPTRVLADRASKVGRRLAG